MLRDRLVIARSRPEQPGAVKTRRDGHGHSARTRLPVRTGYATPPQAVPSNPHSPTTISAVQTTEPVFTNAIQRWPYIEVEVPVQRLSRSRAANCGRTGSAPERPLNRRANVHDKADARVLRRARNHEGRGSGPGTVQTVVVAVAAEELVAGIRRAAYVPPTAPSMVSRQEHRRRNRWRRCRMRRWRRRMRWLRRRRWGLRVIVEPSAMIALAAGSTDHRKAPAALESRTTRQH